jgi:alcohol dehydrogenase (cytochrome c)
MTRSLLSLMLLCASALLAADDGLNPATIAKAPVGSWLTYNGDYSGRRFSPLDQINASNIKNLTLAWAFRAKVAAGGSPFGMELKSTPIELNGVLYFTMPDYCWAVDARTGREIWHYGWKSEGGIHTGNRGVGIYGNWVFVETPDNHLLSLDKNTGKLRWAVVIADLAQEYFSTPAPMIIGNRGWRRFARRSWLSRSARPRRRQIAVALEQRAGQRRTRFGKLAR